jgi:hypothetical protein
VFLVDTVHRQPSSVFRFSASTTRNSARMYLYLPKVPLPCFTGPDAGCRFFLFPQQPSMLFRCFFHAAQTATCSFAACSFASVVGRGLVIPHFRPTRPQPFRRRFVRTAVFWAVLPQARPCHDPPFLRDTSFFALLFSVVQGGYTAVSSHRGLGMYVRVPVKTAWGRGVAVSNLPSSSPMSCPPPPILTQVIGASDLWEPAVISSSYPVRRYLASCAKGGYEPRCLQVKQWTAFWSSS